MDFAHCHIRGEAAWKVTPQPVMDWLLDRALDYPGETVSAVGELDGAPTLFVLRFRKDGEELIATRFTGPDALEAARIGRQILEHARRGIAPPVRTT